MALDIYSIFPRYIGKANKHFNLIEHINKLRHLPSGTPEGWVSNKLYSSFDKDLGNYSEFKPFLDWQDSQVVEYVKKTGIDFTGFKCKSWFNIYKKGDYQELHAHAPDDISTIHMVKGSKESAYTYFKDFQLDSLPGSQSREYFSEGQLLIFPSFLLHGVSQHQLEEERITIASNYNLL